MLGQALIKSIAFSANAFALKLLLLQAHSLNPTLTQLCIAGSFSGFVASFVVNPIERIKVLMQADQNGLYRSEVHCAQEIISSDGFTGLVTRGLDATILREVRLFAELMYNLCNFNLSFTYSRSLAMPYTFWCTPFSFSC